MKPMFRGVAGLSFAAGMALVSVLALADSKKPKPSANQNPGLAKGPTFTRARLEGPRAWIGQGWRSAGRLVLRRDERRSHSEPSDEARFRLQTEIPSQQMGRRALQSLGGVGSFACTWPDMVRQPAVPSRLGIPDRRDRGSLQSHSRGIRAEQHGNGEARVIARDAEGDSPYSVTRKGGVRVERSSLPVGLARTS